MSVHETLATKQIYSIPDIRKVQAKTKKNKKVDTVMVILIFLFFIYYVDTLLRHMEDIPNFSNTTSNFRLNATVKIIFLIMVKQYCILIVKN